MELSESVFNTKKVVLSYVVIELLPNNVMRFEFTRDLNVNMQLTLEMMDICKKISGGKLYLSLKIIKHKFKIDDDVANLFAGDVRKDMMKAEAVVLNSAVLKIFANFYLRVKKPVITTKFFDKEEDAVTWLLTH